LYASPNIIGIKTSRAEMNAACSVHGRDEKYIQYFEGRRPLGRPRRGRKIIFKQS
jgi:hypothetical protein